LCRLGVCGQRFRPRRAQRVLEDGEQRPLHVELVVQQPELGALGLAVCCHVCVACSNARGKGTSEGAECQSQLNDESN
jgi:hypothetical protein